MVAYVPSSEERSLFFDGERRLVFEGHSRQVIEDDDPVDLESLIDEERVVCHAHDRSKDIVLCIAPRPRLQFRCGGKCKRISIATVAYTAVSSQVKSISV